MGVMCTKPDTGSEPKKPKTLKKGSIKKKDPKIMSGAGEDE
jgi:hypothetical protein